MLLAHSKLYSQSVWLHYIGVYDSYFRVGYLTLHLRIVQGFEFSRCGNWLCFAYACIFLGWWCVAVLAQCIYYVQNGSWLVHVWFSSCILFSKKLMWVFLSVSLRNSLYVGPFSMYIAPDHLGGGTICVAHKFGHSKPLSFDLCAIPSCVICNSPLPVVLNFLLGNLWLAKFFSEHFLQPVMLFMHFEGL